MGAAIWSTDPAHDAGDSRRASSCASCTTTACSRSTTGRSGAPSAAARALRGEAHGAVPRPHPPRTPVEQVRRLPGGVLVKPPRAGGERFDAVFLACHSDQALGAARRPERGRARGAGRHPLPGERGGAAHRHPPAAAPPPGLGRLELPRAAADRRPGGADLQHEHPAGLDAPDAVPGDAEPHATRIDPATHHRAHHLSPSGLHARRRGRAGPPRARSTAPAAPSTAAPTGATASTRTAWSARSRWPLARIVRRTQVPQRAQRALHRSSCSRPPRGFAPRRHAFRYRALLCSGSTSTNWTELFARPLAVVDPAPRAGLVPPRRLPRRPARCRSTMPCATCVERETGRRPAGPMRLLTHLRYFGYVLQPGQLLLLLRRGRHAPRSHRRRGHQHALGRAPRLRAARQPATPRTAMACAFRFAKRFHVSPFMPMDHGYDWRFNEPGADACACTWRIAATAQRVFDATLALERREISGREPGPRRWLRFPLVTAQGDPRDLLAGPAPLAQAHAALHAHPPNTRPGATHMRRSTSA